MEQTNTENLFNSLVSGDMDDIQSSFETAIGEKLQQALEIRKVGLTSEVFNESTDLTEAPSVNELKLKGQFNYDSVGGKSVKATIPLLVNIRTTSKGKLKSIEVTADNDKYYNMIRGRGMSAEVSKKREIGVFLKNGRIVFIDLPNNEYNREKGMAGTYSATLDSASLKKVNDAVDSMNEAKQPTATGDAEDAVNESTNLTEAKLEEPKSKGDLADLLKKAKQIRGVSDDEYMLWYGNLDMKMFDAWDKMVKKDSNYKKAYKLGYDGGSDKNPHKSGTLAAAIWDDQYATGAFDA